MQIDSTEASGLRSNVKGAKKKKVKLNRAKLPVGIRCLIYSYLPILDLLNLASKLSRRDRAEIPESTILSQPRNLYIKQLEALISGHSATIRNF